jgi:DNA polymerase-3 subunit gamma/tau
MAETDGAPIEVEVVHKLWPNLIKRVGIGLGLPLTQVEPSWLAASGPDVLVIRPSAGYNGIALECDVPEARARIAQELSKLLNRPVTIRFDRGAIADEPGSDGGGNTPTSSSSTPVAPSPTGRRPTDLEGDPMVQKVVQLFEARPVHLEVDEERGDVERN